MSVCHSPGTLSLCVHGVPEKFNCPSCEGTKINCPYCSSEKLIIARDGKSTRKCTQCFNTWLPSDVFIPDERQKKEETSTGLPK